jgi:uncharacterized membrane protein YccF (DUF307 family)
MRNLGNILWHFPFFGFVTATFTWLLGGLLTLTVIAAPVGLGLMEYGKLLFWPFGNAMVSKSQLNTEQNKAWKTYSTIVTILYFPFGLFFTICAIFQVIALCLSIIGIPAAMVIAKSLSTFLNPVNKKCVPSAVVGELERRKAHEQVNKYLGNTSAPQQQAINQIVSNPQTDVEQQSNTLSQQEKTVGPNTASINDQLGPALKNLGSFVSKNRKILLGGFGLLLVGITFYKLFIKANPVGDGKKLAKLYCSCSNDLNKNNLTSMQSYLTEFDSKKFKSRTDARNSLSNILQKNQTKYSNCTQSANIKYTELLADYNAKGGRNAHTFQQTYSSISNACANTNSSDAVALQSQIDEKIKSIIDPEPDIEKIKADLIGQEIIGWKFSYLNEYKTAEILSSAKSNDRIEYQVKFNLIDNTTNSGEHDCEVMVVYEQSENGWYLSGVNLNYIVYINTFYPDRYVQIAPFKNCKWNADNNYKMSWKTSNWEYASETITGPDKGATTLPYSTTYFIKSLEPNEIKVRFTYRPNN